MKIPTIVLAMAAMVLSAAGPATAAPVGELTAVVGRVDITSPGDSAREAAPGDLVERRDIIRTKSDAKAEITFIDGSIVRIAPGSRVAVERYAVDGDRSEGRLTLFRGKLRSIVRKKMARWFGGGGDEGRFEVKTPTMVAGVRGTDFFTAYQRGVSSAVFREGEGYGYNIQRPEEEVFIEAGEAMIIEGFDALPMIRPVSALELRMHLEETAVSGPAADAGGETTGSGTGPGEGPEGEGAGGTAGPPEGGRRAGSPGRGMGPAFGFLGAGDRLEMKEDLLETAYIDIGAFEADDGYFYGLETDAAGAVGIRIPETGEFIPMGRLPGVSRDDLSNYLTETWELYVGNTSGYFLDGSERGGSIFVSPMVREETRLTDGDWRITNAFVSGTYQGIDGATFDSWGLDLAYLEGTTGRFDHFTGRRWTEGTVEADVASAWVDWRSCVTGMGGGDLTGAYDPGSESWQGTGRWVTMTTDRFFEMLGEGGGGLRSLDIPAFEVGRATLTGAGGGLDVALEDVVFLGYAAGGPPALWATAGVSGSFTAVPAEPVVLSGGGLRAEFSVRSWNDGCWTGLVENGSGNLSPERAVSFEGGAAGRFDAGAGTFSGAAVGTAGEY